MKIAYLCNQYPAPSHTFIRREIVALEERGVDIQRISIRRSRAPLVDPADVRESLRTHTLLDEPGKVVLSVITALCRHPIMFARALGAAIRSSRTSTPGVKHLAYFAEACRLRALCRTQGITHIHAHMGTNPGAVARFCRLLNGPAYSLTLHGPDEWDDPDGLEIRAKARDARFVVCISEYAREQCERCARAEDHAKIVVVRCGVDDAFLSAEPLACPSERSFVCVGRLCDAKRQTLLVEVFRELVQDYPDARLTLLGDGESRAEIERLIDRHGIGDSVRVHGWATQEEVLAHIDGARALVLPSVREGLPVVIMEAMARARPVISTSIAGIPELVQHAENGWLVPPDNKDALLDAMRACVRSGPAELRRMGEIGRERVIRLHDARENAGELGRFFTQFDPSEERIR